MAAEEHCREDRDRRGMSEARDGRDSRADCSVIVLAGGRSRRFGSDKLAVKIDGIKLVDRVVEAASAITTELVVVGRIHESAKSVQEPEPRRGPLNAVSTALAFASRDCVLVLAGDHPFLHTDLLKMLIASLDNHDAVVPVDRSERPQPLVACYRRSLGQAMSDAVAAGTLSISAFLEQVDVRWLQPEEWQRVDPIGLSFLDIDTVADLEMLELNEPDDDFPVDEGPGGGEGAGRG